MKKQSGFTLLELIVATAIFVIMSAMIYGMLDGVRRQLEFSDEAANSLRELHYAMRRIALDVTQLQPRPVRDELGTGWAGAVQTGASTGAIELSVGGWRNPTYLPRGSIQRVSYLVDDQTLVRLHWPVLDRTLGNEPLRTDLLNGVVEIQIRFLDESGEWTEQWPPFGGDAERANRDRPRAIEVTIEHEQWGLMNRVIEIAG